MHYSAPKITVPKFGSLTTGLLLATLAVGCATSTPQPKESGTLAIATTGHAQGTIRADDRSAEVRYVRAFTHSEVEGFLFLVLGETELGNKDLMETYFSKAEDQLTGITVKIGFSPKAVADLNFYFAGEDIWIPQEDLTSVTVVLEPIGEGGYRGHLEATDLKAYGGALTFGLDISFDAVTEHYSAPRPQSSSPPEGDKDRRVAFEPLANSPPKTVTLDSGQVATGNIEILSYEKVRETQGVVGAMTVAIEKYPDHLRNLLEEEGVGPNLRLTSSGGEHWSHPLEKAVRQGTQETFEILLKAGADPNGSGSDGLSAMHEAARRGRLGQLRQLLEAGGNPKIIAQGEMEQALARRSAELGFPYEPGIGSTVLEQAAGKGQTEIVAYLLDLGVEMRYALHAAARNGSVEVIQMLLDHGADSTLLTVDDTGPLARAVPEGHLEAVKLLLAAGARPSERALSSAAQNARDDVLRAFAEAGVRFDGPPYAWDPLYSAAHAGHVSTVTLLLELGASTAGREGLGAPIDAAREQGHPEVVVLLAANATD